jgi:hypothetical protein
MDLTPFGFPKSRNAAVILGAGATRGGAYFDSNPLRRPPLDSDFFQLLRASPIGASDLDAQRLLDFIQTEFGSLAIRMETFYSQAYLHDKSSGMFHPVRRGKRVGTGTACGTFSMCSRGFSTTR